MAWLDLVRAKAPSEALAWAGRPCAAKGSWVVLPTEAQSPCAHVLRTSWRSHVPSRAHHGLFCNCLDLLLAPRLPLGFCLDAAA